MLCRRRPPLKKLGMLVHWQRSYRKMSSPAPCRLERPCARVQKMIALSRRPGTQSLPRKRRPRVFRIVHLRPPLPELRFFLQKCGRDVWDTCERAGSGDKAQTVDFGTYGDFHVTTRRSYSKAGTETHKQDFGIRWRTDKEAITDGSSGCLSGSVITPRTFSQ